jgi:hypothetical protein
MTPAQFSRAIAAHSRRMRTDARRDAVIAHQTAAFSRAEKLPRLARILEKFDATPDGAPRAPQSVESMLQNAKAWTKLLGGRINGKAVQ